MTRTALQLGICCALAACGGGASSFKGKVVTVETYLSTPAPNSATEARAMGLCRRDGLDAEYRQTLVREDRHREIFTHVYECL